MTRANQDIRAAARESGIMLWQVADKMKMHDANLSRKLRHELPDDQKQKIFNIIDELKQEVSTQ